jgi:hypothetical protein
MSAQLVCLDGLPRYATRRGVVTALRTSRPTPCMRRRFEELGPYPDGKGKCVRAVYLLAPSPPCRHGSDGPRG